MRISFTGDIMCELPMLRACKKGRKYDFTGIFDNVKATFADSDYIVGNLETICAGSKAGYSKDIYSYNTPDAFLHEIKDFGFDLVSTANNHCLDRGIGGLDRTISLLDKLNIEHTGTYRNESDRQHFIIKQFGTYKVGFLSYTYGTNYKINHFKLDDLNEFKVNLLSSQTQGESRQNHVSMTRSIKNKIFTKEFRVKWLRKLGRPYSHPRSDDYLPDKVNPQFFKDIECIRKSCDIVVLLMHSGGQFNSEPGSYSKIIVEEALKSGVSCIIGNHPHVVQKAGLWGKSFISYSLGNFLISTSTPYLIPDYKPEYSIVVHMDLDDEISYTFSIMLLLEKRDGVARVYDTWELYSTMPENEKKRLEQDCSFIYERVTGNKSTNFEMAKEYAIDYTISS